MTRSDSAPTDPLDSVLSELPAGPQILAGLFLLALGVALFRFLKPRLFDASAEPLQPDPAIDLPTLMVAVGVLFVAMFGAARLLGFEPAPSPAPEETPTATEAALLPGGEEPGARPDDTADDTADDTEDPAILAEDGTGSDGTSPAEIRPEQVRLGMLTMALAMLITVGTLVAFLRRRGSGAAALGLRLGPDPAREVRRGILTYVCAFPAMTGATFLWSGILALFGATPATQEAVENLGEIGADPLFLVSTALVVPFCEEVLFRGVLLAWLLRTLPRPGAALLVGAALFALVHDGGGAPVFTLGLAMAWLYWRTRSLIAPIVLHVCHNTFVSWIVLRSAVS